MSKINSIKGLFLVFLGSMVLTIIVFSLSMGPDPYAKEERILAKLRQENKELVLENYRIAADLGRFVKFCQVVATDSVADLKTLENSKNDSIEAFKLAEVNVGVYNRRCRYYNKILKDLEIPKGKKPLPKMELMQTPKPNDHTTVMRDRENSSYNSHN